MVRKKYVMINFDGIVNIQQLDENTYTIIKDNTKELKTWCTCTQKKSIS